MLKATGIVRQVDDLGRFVIPKEIRNVLDIKERDSLEVFVNGEQVILRKYTPGCIFCGNADIAKTIEGKHVCAEHIRAIAFKWEGVANG